MTMASSSRDRYPREDLLDEDWFHLFALDEMARVLRSEEPYELNGHSGLLLLKTAHLRVVLEVARAGSEIGQHTVQGPTFVQVLMGSLRLESGDETRIAHGGELAVVPHGRPRKMVAEEDCAFLWVLAVSP